jgi:ATP-dependent exoDNAse (exonuclease V) alpha subunit
MLTRNWQAQGLVHGSMGEVAELNATSGTVGVYFDRAPTTLVTVGRWAFDIEATGLDDAPPAAVRHQLPLQLAWAMTVHRAQGLTLSWAVMHLDRAWTCSQLYVALARLKSLEGLYLTENSYKKLCVGKAADAQALSFYEKLVARDARSRQ